jgi:hypothetical protein
LPDLLRPKVAHAKIQRSYESTGKTERSLFQHRDARAQCRPLTDRGGVKLAVKVSKDEKSLSGKGTPRNRPCTLHAISCKSM